MTSFVDDAVATDDERFEVEECGILVDTITATNLGSLLKQIVHDVKITLHSWSYQDDFSILNFELQRQEGKLKEGSLSEDVLNVATFAPSITLENDFARCSWLEIFIILKCFAIGLI